MSPKKTSRAPKRRRDRLSIQEDFDLKSGNHSALSFATEAERREAWENHGSDIMSRWHHPARRPWAWWTYEMDMAPPRRHDPRDPADFNHQALWLAKHGHLAPWEIDHLRTRCRPSDGPALDSINEREGQA